MSAYLYPLQRTTGTVKGLKVTRLQCLPIPWIIVIVLSWRIQDFPERGANSQSGCANLLLKLHENERIWTLLGGASLALPFWIRQCIRSMPLFVFNSVRKMNDSCFCLLCVLSISTTSCRYQSVQVLFSSPSKPEMF